jgi:hypothetical protein
VGGSSGDALHCTAVRCAAQAGARLIAVLYVLGESEGVVQGTSECATRYMYVWVREVVSE